jgi:hypothetical protein
MKNLASDPGEQALTHACVFSRERLFQLKNRQMISGGKIKQTPTIGMISFHKALWGFIIMFVPGLRLS